MYNAKSSQLDADLKKKQEDLEQKQAKRKKALSIFEALVNTAVATTSALKAGPIIGPILAGVVAALGAVQVATIAAQQYAKGRYPVQGRDDKRTYDARYVGKPKTGVYSEPALGLFSEKKPEMVVDGNTTEKLMLNYPELYNSILNIARGGTPQYSDGRYVKKDESIQQTYRTTSDKDMMKVLSEATAMFRELQQNGLKADVVLSDLERKQKLRDRSRNIASK